MWGNSSLSNDGYIEGAPELVVEIAANTATIDLREKKRAYRRNGVKEYIVWQVRDRTTFRFAIANLTGLY